VAWAGSFLKKVCHNMGTNKGAAMSENKTFTEEFSVNGEQLLAKVKELIREGNIRRVSIKDKSGKVIVEFPLTIGVVGAALAPALAAVGAIAALVSEATVVVEKTE
jgi:hypothetical protein